MENWLLDIDIAVGIFLRRTNQNQMEQRHFFTEYIGLEMDQFFKGGNKCDLFRTKICKFNNPIDNKINNY